jgi:CubicO group peptidase (beta-lactamase class C family)
MDAARLDEIFGGVSPREPGCAVGVVRDGELVYCKGFGSSDLEHDVPVTPNSVFDVASSSKQFTAASALALSIEGRFGLDDPVCDHLPVLPRGVFGKVTVRQLIHHTAGVPDHLYLLALSGRDLANHYPDDELLELLARQRQLDFEPGTAFSYSNGGYLLLAELVKETSGATLRQVAQERIFGPAGMTRSFFRDDHTELIPNRAVGYGPGTNGFAIDMPLGDSVGDGGLQTTVGDLAKWDRQFYRCTLPAGPDFMELLQRTGALNDGTPIGYAFGLFVDELGPVRRVHHNGDFAGYRCQFVRYPEERTTVIVLANSRHAPMEEYTSRITQVVLGDKTRPAAPQAEQVRPAGSSGHAESRFDQCTGTYADGDPRMVVQLVLDGGSPMLALPTAGISLPLTPSGPDSFVAGAMGLDLTVTLRPDDRIRLQGGLLGDFDMARHASPPPAEGELAAAVGDYRSDELDAVLRLRLVDGTIHGRIGWGPIRPLTAHGAGLFTGEGHVVQVQSDGPGAEARIGSVRTSVQRFARLP